MSVAAFLALTNKLAEIERAMVHADTNVKTAYDSWKRAAKQQAVLIDDRTALLRAIAREKAILEQKEGNP